MKPNHRNAARRNVTSTLEAQSLALDENLRRAFEGDRNALNAIARELHPRLVHEARQHLGAVEHEADDVVQDLFVAILEGRVRAPRGRGECLAHLLRLAGELARKHARDVRRFHGLP